MFKYQSKVTGQFITKEQYDKENKIMEDGISTIMAGTINNMEKENNNMSGQIDLQAVLNDINNQVDDVKYGGEMLEGKGLVDVFGSSAKIAKVSKQYKKGTTAQDNMFNIVVAFEPVNGKKYFTFLSGGAKQKMAILLDTVGGESQLNNIIEQKGLKACFGNRVFETTDDSGKVHTNVKVWFETV